MSRSKDDEHRQALRHNMVELCENVDPEQLLPHLPCLSEYAKQRIKCELRNNGQYSANQLLFQELPRKDDWFEQLINAFQHPSVDQYSLADKLQSTEDQSNVQRCKPRCKSSTLRSTPERNKIKGAKPEPLSMQSRVLDLPYLVPSAMKLLDCDNCWKDFAGALGYSFEDVMSFESNAKDNSYTEIVLRDWSKKHNPRLQDLVDILVRMERWDVIHKLKNIPILQHIPFPEQNNKITRTSTCEIEDMPLPVSDCIHDDMEKNLKEEAKVVQLQKTDKDSKSPLQTNSQQTDEYITGINTASVTLSNQISPRQASPNHISKMCHSTQPQDSAEQICAPLLNDHAETVQFNCSEHPNVTQERSMSEPRQICIAASPVPNDIKMNVQKQIHEEIDKPRLILGGTCPTSLESGGNIGKVPPNTGCESVIDDRLKGPQVSLEIDGCERSPSSSTHTNVENVVLSEEQTISSGANCSNFGHNASGDVQISYCKNESLDQIGLERENGKRTISTISNGTSPVTSNITSVDTEEENQRPDSLLLGATSPYTVPATMSSEEPEVDRVRNRDSQDRSSNRLMESLPIIVGAGAVIALMFSLSR